MPKSKRAVSSVRIHSRRAKSRHRKRRGFCIEPLEDRRLLAVAAVDDPDDAPFYDAVEDEVFGVGGSVLVATESTWDFLDELPASGDGSYPVDDEGDAWNSLAFDVADTAANSHGNWDSGQAMFVAGTMSGFPDGGNTTLDGTQGNPNPVNTYLFRTTMQLDAAQAAELNAAAIGGGEAIAASLFDDDSGILYINGTEVMRDNISDPVDSTSLAAGNGNESNFHDEPVDLTGVTFFEGDNAVAFELHQASANSSDAGFDIELSYTANSVTSVLANDLLDGNPIVPADMGTAVQAILTGAMPAGGTVDLQPNGQFTFTPDPNYFNDPADSNDFFWFEYVADDGTGQIDGANVGRVRIKVAPVNDVPTAVHDYYTGEEGETIDASFAFGDPAAIIPPGASWFYDDSGAKPATGWQTSGLGATQGPAKLGFGNRTYEKTTLADGNSAYYFFRAFDVAGTAPETLYLALKRDDGAIVYINGTEVYRDGNIDPALDPVPNDYRTPTTAPDDGEEFALIAVDNTGNRLGLQAAGNAIAVEVHQFTGSDSDISFDLQLSENAGRIGLLANDFDVEDANAGLRVVVAPDQIDPAVASFSVNAADGTFVFDPVNDYLSGTFAFDYQTVDGEGGTSTVQTVRITLAAVDYGPVTANDDVAYPAGHANAGELIFVTDEDVDLVVDATTHPAWPAGTGDPEFPGGFGIGVLANDTTAIKDWGDPLTLSVDTAPANGTVTLNDDGSFTYSPDADFNGVDTFTYIVNDGFTDSNAAMVVITVNAVVDPPVGTNDFYMANEGETIYAGTPEPVTEPSDPNYPLIPIESLWRYSDYYVPDDGDPLTTGDPSDQSYVNDGVTAPAWNGPASNGFDPDTAAGWFQTIEDPPGIFTDVPNVGPAELGFGGDGAVTPMNRTSGNITYYFQRTFDLPEDVNLFTLTELDVLLKVDDGAVVYINGEEAFRHNMPQDDPAAEPPVVVDFQTLALGTVVPDARDPNNPIQTEEEYVAYRVDVGGIPLFASTEGTNTIAVEVHQATSGSSDISFDLQLSLPDPGPVPNRFGLLANDTGNEIPVFYVTVVDGQPLVGGSATVVVNGGTLDVSEDGTFTFVPEPAFFGIGGFDYEITDGNTARVSILMLNTPDAPVAVDDSYSVDQGDTLAATLTVDSDLSAEDAISLVARGSVWKYLDTGTDEGGTGQFDPEDASWFAGPSYVDTDWQQGRAELGYGDGGEMTTVNYVDVNPDPNVLSRNATTYFRHRFVTPEDIVPEDVASLILGVQRDDGVAVYLNGVEIARDNLGAGARYDTYTSSSVSGSGELIFYVFRDVDPTLLKPAGQENVIAAEIHQVSPTSSDISFDLELRIPDPNKSGVLMNDYDVDREAITVTTVNGLPLAEGVPVATVHGQVTVGADGTFLYEPDPTYSGPDGFSYGNIDASGMTSNTATVSIDVVAPPVSVLATDPADGATVGSAPVRMQIDFDDDVQPASVDAADLTIDGIAAVGVTLVDGDTVSFDLPAGLVPGPHVAAMAEGAIVSLDGGPLTAYSGSFTIAAPAEVANLAPVNVTTFLARLRAEVTATGFDNPALRIYWGDEDGGTDPSAWDDWADVGVVSAGSYSRQISGLSTDTAYYFRAMVSNAAGDAWAAQTDGFATPASAVDPVINEFMADNGSSLADEDGNFSDWIEIFNPDASPLDLTGWYLTDKADNLTKWEFPATVVQPGQFLVVFASEKNRRVSGSELHTNFKLGAGGEYLAMVKPEAAGVTIVHEYAPAYPPQSEDVSYGLRVDDGTEDFFSPATPGNPNVGGRIVINEIMYHPSTGLVAQEYIELANVGGLSVNLNGWQLTNGVDYTFGSVAIAPGEFLVVAADPAEFQSKYGVGATVAGPWTGRLSNRGEAIELTSDQGQFVDRVRYADEGDWARRVEGPLDRGSTGWIWDAGHDGQGKSLELVNPALDNDEGQNWAASLGDDGTPGNANSTASDDVAPMILDVGHEPAIPRPADPVTVTATLLDEMAVGTTAAVFYRVSTLTPGAFIELEMLDDGLSGDGAPDDGVFGAVLPAQVDGAVVEFYVQASDVVGNTRTWPAPTNAVEPQSTNALYQVDDSIDVVDQPYYRLIMTEADRDELENIDRQSDAQMHGTLVTADGAQTQIRHNVGIKIRGAGSRSRTPPNYRVNIPHDDSWNGVAAMNLNTQYTHSQIAGSAIFRAAGNPAADFTAVQVRVNGEQLANAGSRQYGSYVHLEVENVDFANAHFPDDPNGNLYKGKRPDSSLRYLGDSPDPYRASYEKRTNAGDDDWSDLIRLTDVLNNGPLDPAKTYVEELAQVADVDQWLEYFALNTLLANNETSLGTGVGDDYILYRGVADPRFILIPRDMDTLLGEGDNPGNVDGGLYRAANLPALANFLLRPEIIPRYHATLKRLAETVLAPESINPLLQNVLGGYVPQAVIDRMQTFAAQRIAYVLSRISETFTAGSSLPIVGGYPRSLDPGTGAISGTADTTVTSTVLVGGVEADYSPVDGTWFLDSSSTQSLVSMGATWKYLDDGSDQGTAWIDPDPLVFDDSAWAEGPAELGYGEGDEATVVGYVDADPVADGMQKNATTYFRYAFDVDSAIDVATLESLVLNVGYDDSVAVYLNGAEIAREGGLPAGAAYDTYAGGGEITWSSVSVDPALLRQNGNVLAAEVHQANTTSSDISFDVELSATFQSTGPSTPLLPGVNAVPVVALDPLGQEVGRTYVDIWYDNGTTTSVSGTINTDTTWDLASSPYLVTGDVDVAAGATLSIEPGVTVFFQADRQLTVRGRLIAQGTPELRIQLTHDPANPGNWNGIRFDQTLEDNLLSYVDMQFGDEQGESIYVDYSKLHVDNMAWANVTRTVIEVLHPSLLVTDSVFPDVNAEVIHGQYIENDEYLIVDGNVFTASTSGGDVIDFLGADRPGPVFQVLNNVFLGGYDDGLDLDGTDAHIEGNIFMNFRYNTPRTTTSNAIATGLPQSGEDNRTQITVVRNIFIDNDHALLLKEDAFATVTNNVFLGMTEAVVQFNEIGGTAVNGPGLGALMDGNIFLANAKLFKNLINDGTFTTTLSVNRSLMPDEMAVFEDPNGILPPTSIPAVDLGVGNVVGDPRFVDPSPTVQPDGSNVAQLFEAFRLLPGSPALATGPNGLDMGYDVPAGASLSGEPAPITAQAGATLTVAGPGITHYQFQLDDGTYSADVPVDTPITLSNLPDGPHTVSVLGRDSAYRWQPSPTVSQTWTVDAGLVQLQINEVLAANVTAFDHAGTFPDAIELYNAGADTVDLAGMSITDDADVPGKFVFPAGTTLDAGQFLVLLANTDDGTGGLHLGFSLGVDGEGVYLFESLAGGAALIDQVEFGPQAADLSIGRDGDGQWALSQPTFGTANVAQPLGDPDMLSINEWLATDGPMFGTDFIELFNADTLPVALGGLYLTDHPVARPAWDAIRPLSFIGAGRFTLFTADGDPQDGPSHLDFRLDRLQGMIGLADADGRIIDQVIYGPQRPDVSTGRVTDGDPLYQTFSPPTLGTTNNLTIIDLLDFTDTWTFNDQGADLTDTGWIDGDYDDSGWGSGPGLLYVENDVLPEPKGTELTLSGDNTTYYFRTQFTFSGDLSAVSALQMRTILDDGAIFYLNEQEIFRLGIDPDLDPVGYADVANRGIGNASYEGIFSIDPSQLVVGDNVLAVEVHQNIMSSSDVVLGVELKAAAFNAAQQRTLDLIDGLRVTEILFNPYGGEEHEFIELRNMGSTVLNLDGVRLAEAVEFEFGDVDLAPGEKTVVVADLAAFEARFGTGLNVAGEFTGQLNNGGDNIALKLPRPMTYDILNFTYDDDWYPAAAAAGYSFGMDVGIDPGDPDAWNDPAQWTPSRYPNGSPGREDLDLDADAIVINEVLAHGDGPEGDWIELLNTTNDPIDVGGWFLSDSALDRAKYAIAPGTQIPPGGYLVLTEAGNFGPGSGDPGSLVPFALSELGDDVHLSAAYGDGYIAGYQQLAEFAASPNGITFGRLVNSAGEVDFVALQWPTFGDANAPAVVGPIVINEIHYHPTAGGVEFIELKNVTGVDQPLFDPANTGNPDSVWRLTAGVEMAFGVGDVIPAGRYALLLPDSVSAEQYRLDQSVPADVPIFQWDSVQWALSNGGERIVLSRPGVPEGPESPTPGLVPRIVADMVRYDDALPWPPEADGAGPSLVRLDPAAYGNDPANWAASILLGPTPGYDNATYVVDSLADVVADDGVLTLREALEAANANLPLGDADAITFDPALFAAGPATITLDGTQLEITDDVDLQGPGSELLTIDAGGQSRVFFIASGIQAGISGLALTGGAADFGAGILAVQTSLDLVDVHVNANAASVSGGGIYIDNLSGQLHVANSVIVGNSADSGGGIYNDNSTLAVTNTTITANAATLRGGGLFDLGGSGTIANTIIALNTADGGDPDLADWVPTADGPNLIGIDPLFMRNPSPGTDGTWGTADDDWGDLRLRSGGPAIDAGDNALAVDADGLPLTTDMAGNPRIVDGDGDGTDTVDVGALEFVPATLDGRFVFYNNSAFDGDQAEANVLDDAAIASDKTALLPGDSATPENVTSYNAGINGVMVDVGNLADPAGLSESDFVFRVSSTGQPGSWTTAPTPADVDVRGGGFGEPYRITITFNDGDIQNQWLEVTLKATVATGLMSDDVFYFGNAVGETGNQPANLLVNAADVIAIRDHPRGPGNPATVDDPHDVNRDGRVDATDMILARDYATGPLSALRLFDAPAILPAPAPAESEPTADASAGWVNTLDRLLAVT